MNININWDPRQDTARFKQIECGLFVPEKIANRRRHLDLSTVKEYEMVLRNRGKAWTTVQKYTHDIQCFVIYLGERPLSIGIVREWLEGQKQKRHVNTVNNAISALNGFFHWLDRGDCCCSFFRVQQLHYREDSRDLNLGEFNRLIDMADDRMKAIALTFKGTGIRVSELRFFTVEAVRRGIVTVDNKGKVRTVFLDPGTKTLLQNYCEKHGIGSGVIFHNRLGLPLSRSFIWRSFKELAKKAGLALSKVFPHNLRHLFAVERYKVDHDIEALRLDMGHTLVSTTQRYLKETVSAHFEKLLQRATLNNTIIKNAAV